VLLHPYNETTWNDQVLHEGLGVRIARATNHLRTTLMAGFTTIRDLGTEGAGYTDVELKQAVDQGIIPGPRMIVVTRAIVATGSYGPKGFALEWHVPQGAEEADGDAAFVAKALGEIARAKGMSQVARDAGLSRESLYKALSGERSPDFETILKVMGALGLRLHAEAAHG
jgi:probable addiction module antidote protein